MSRNHKLAMLCAYVYSRSLFRASSPRAPYSFPLRGHERTRELARIFLGYLFSVHRGMESISPAAKQVAGNIIRLETRSTKFPSCRTDRVPPNVFSRIARKTRLRRLARIPANSNLVLETKTRHDWTRDAGCARMKPASGKRTLNSKGNCTWNRGTEIRENFFFFQDWWEG